MSRYCLGASQTFREVGPACCTGTQPELKVLRQSGNTNTGKVRLIGQGWNSFSLIDTLKSREGEGSNVEEIAIGTIFTKALGKSGFRDRPPSLLRDIGFG